MARSSAAFVAEVKSDLDGGPSAEEAKSFQLLGQRARPRKKIEYAPIRKATYLKPPGSCQTRWPETSISVEIACCVDCTIAILDPTLTVTQPRTITALTGIDALAHAIETFVTNRRNPISITLSREAWRLLAGNFARVLDAPDDLEARAGMQLGACFAGMAIENSMLGATHALANPLTADYGIVHGQAIGSMLSHVIRFNAVECASLYHDLLETTAGTAGFPCPQDGFEGLADFVDQLVVKAGLHLKLSDCGVEATQLTKLAGDAAAQWTGNFNPRKVDAPTLQSIYEQAF